MSMDTSTMNCILSAEVTFDKGEKAVRDFASTLGPIVQCLVPHFTLYYGGKPFAPEWASFFAQFSDPTSPVYTVKPVVKDIKLFFNSKKNYHAVAVEYDWSPAKQVNTAVAWTPALAPRGPSAGFNCDKFEAHVTIAYIDGSVDLDVEAIKRQVEDMSLFDVSIKGLTLETDVKPHK